MTVTKGSVPHGQPLAADSHAPVLIGGRATAAAPAGVTEGDAVGASFDLTGNLRTTGGAGGAGGGEVTGDVASGAADGTSKPVKVGGRHNSTTPTLTDGQRGDLQLNTRGILRAELSISNTAIAANGMTDGATGSVLLPVANALYNGTTFDRVRGGAGAVSAGVQRMTLASDDPAVAFLNTVAAAIVASKMQTEIAASVLPTGAATQTTLAAVLAALPAALGLQTAAQSLPVVLASDSFSPPVEKWTTLDVVTGSAYASGDCLGETVELTNLVPANGGAGVIETLLVLDLQDTPDKADVELWLFNAAPTLAADDSPFDPTDAELATLVCPPIASGPYSETADNAVSARYVGYPFKCASGTRSLWGQLVSRGVPNFVASTDVKYMMIVSTG